MKVFQIILFSQNPLYAQPHHRISASLTPQRPSSSASADPQQQQQQQHQFIPGGYSPYGTSQHRPYSAMSQVRKAAVNLTHFYCILAVK